MHLGYMVSYVAVVHKSKVVEEATVSFPVSLGPINDRFTVPCIPFFYTAVPRIL